MNASCQLIFTALIKQIAPEEATIFNESFVTTEPGNSNVAPTIKSRCKEINQPPLYRFAPLYFFLLLFNITFNTTRRDEVHRFALKIKLPLLCRAFMDESVISDTTCFLLLRFNTFFITFLLPLLLFFSIVIEHIYFVVKLGSFR